MSTLLKLNFQHYIENMVEIKKKKKMENIRIGKRKLHPCPL